MNARQADMRKPGADGTGDGESFGLRMFVRRSGWWGTSMALASIFFLVGGLISLLNGDWSVAGQALLVAALLVGGAFAIAARRRPD